MAEQKLWQTEEEFEAMLRASLSTIQPPADFSERVMSAVRLEAAANKPVAEPKSNVLRLPRLARRWSMGLGSCAAAVLLFCAVSVPLAEAPTGLPFGVDVRLAQNTQTAALLEQPARVTGVEEPVQTEPEAPARSAAVTANVSGNSGVQVAAERPDNPVQREAEAPLTPGTGELILPRAAYGSTAQGTLSVRLLAKVEGNAIYAPSLSSRGKSAAFYTVDEQNIYTWLVDLAEAAAPEVTAVTPLADGDEALAGTARPVDATTLVKSPDGTMLAQNSREGVWISLAEGEVFLLTEEGAGRLLTWSPDSSKILFTNESGALFVGYPLERRIYQVTDMAVKDICWSSDNKTVIFQAEVDGEDCLYVAETV